MIEIMTDDINIALVFCSFQSHFFSIDLEMWMDKNNTRTDHKVHGEKSLRSVPNLHQS